VDADRRDGVCANAEGQCSLRAAVMEANTSTPLGIADTIVLSPGTYQLTIPEVDRGFDSDVDGDLVFLQFEPVAIVGAGPARTTIEQTAGHRVMSVRGGGDVDLSGVTVTGGDVTRAGDHAGGGGGGIFNAGMLAVRHARINGNRAETAGGGIGQLALAGPSLELDHVTVRNNEAGTGGGVSASSALMRFATVRDNVAVSGGGIGGSVELRNSLVAGNRAVGSPFSSHGGGLRGGGLVVDTTIRGNRAEVGGGGIATRDRGSLRVERSTLVANEAREGGGVFLEGFGRFTNSTLNDNHATADGGAIFQRRSGFADARRPELVLESSTLAENTAGSGVDGIADAGGIQQVVGTILANGENCGDPVDDSIGWNLETGTSCELGGPGDLSSTGPGLRPLTDNGGATWTHAIRADSPAIDANAFSRCPGLDQRTALRPAGERCDIGSYERDAAFLPTPLRPSRGSSSSAGSRTSSSCRSSPPRWRRRGSRSSPPAGPRAMGRAPDSRLSSGTASSRGATPPSSSAGG
ncbi:MAG: choice-of-anchor Q domain-containing protein, partial [Solirubrobacterales bacterium]